MSMPRTEIDAALRSAFQLFIEGNADLSESLMGLAAHSKASDGSGLQAFRQALSDFLSEAVENLGEDQIHVVNFLSSMANLEGMLGSSGDPLARQEAIRRVVAIHDRMQNPSLAFQAVLGLANAQSDAQQWDEALISYRDAETRAEQIRNLSLTSQAQRNYGLCLAEAGKRIEAEELLRKAIFSAACAIDVELLGRSHVALGIFLQHGGHLDQALDVLNQGIKILPPDHADAQIARSHLTALNSGKNCDCEI
jgi:tetratricopeptide (TPR) repeat protein